MKPLRHFFSRALGACKPGKGKAGSSLALVMMVGAALVIWVMCIMPLMATTGATAAKTEQNYDDYLDSRSSIEYCKSELQDIVTREMPYTFAVIREIDPADGKISYRAIEKIKGAATNPEYLEYVDTTAASPTDDTQHKPWDNEKGNKVAAICAVGPESGGVYDITITTFHNGEKGQSYSLSFTVSGSLLIFPESYKQNDALPLSDFAVVDGKMGANQVWNSTIAMGTAVDPSTGGSGNFTETLLPWKLEPDANYADTGEYPAAFKKTANAAEYSEGGLGDPIIEAPFTDEKWVMPTAVSGSGNKAGEIWWDYNGNTIAVYLYKDSNNQKVNITESCTIYLNGVERKDKTVPAQEGYYCVTVDYNGTGAYDPSENAVNILPASGLRMPDVVYAVGDKSVDRQTKPGAHSFEVERVSGPDIYTFSVTLTPTSESDNTGILYACCNGTETPVDGKIPLTWSESPTFTGLNADETWYFYACRPAEIRTLENGTKKYYADSKIAYLGAVCPLEFATSLDNNTAYAIVGKNNGIYAMGCDATSDNWGNTHYTMTAVSLQAGDGYMVVPSGDSISIPTWTAEGSGDQWYLKNGNNYLTMTGTYESFLFWGSWKLTLSTASEDDGNGLFTVGFGGSDGTDAKVSRLLKSGRHSTTGYLSLSTNSGFTATEDSSYVKFLKAPNVGTAPSVTSPSDYALSMKDSLGYGTAITVGIAETSKNNVITLPENVIVEKLYANGVETKVGTKLAPGVYYMTAKLEVGTSGFAEDGKPIPVYRCVQLGKLTIDKGDNPNVPSLLINRDDKDDLTVIISTTAPAYDINNENFRNMLLFGYKTSNENDFHWYPADKDDKQCRSFRLEPGAYDFAVCRFGDSTYEAVTTEVTYPVEFTEVELPQDWGSQFEYTYNEETGEIVYYRHLPDKVTPSRIQLVFGYEDDNDKISWHTERNDSIEIKDTIFGLIVTKSKNYGDMEHVLLKRPYGINNLNGHTDSIMRGSSLYFMGRDNSINTYGNSVYLYADLVVLNSPIALGPDEKGNPTGHVYVEPYSTGKNAPGDVLLFTVNDITCNNGVTFNKRTFYRIPKDTDLCNPDASKIKPLGDVQTKDVKDLFRLGVYPEINLDIAYASDEQLAHVVSSETIRWTDKGELRGTDTNTNAGYVVCAYVSNINGSVSYKANRVLIATGSDSHYTLNVPANLTFTTRYLSIEADQVMGNGASFTIKNLGQDSSFIQSISNALGLTGYSSKTLQVDFERNTQIVSGDTMSNVERQICRYDDGDDDGADLFSATPQSLMAPYTTSEIRNLFSNKVSATVKTVDRYIALSCKDGSGSLDIGALVNCELDIYANYIFVDESVKEINVSSLFSNSDLKISSQESGYTTNEYLGLFKDHSAESYSGTLIYFEGDVYFTYSEGFLDTKTAKIEKGFYYVYAKDDGTSLKDLATNLFVGTDPNDNTAKKPYKIDPSSLKNYSVYIDSNGNISNAYVDTGIWDNTNTGLGGFSGGNVG